MENLNRWSALVVIVWAFSRYADAQTNTFTKGDVFASFDTACTSDISVMCVKWFRPDGTLVSTLFLGQGPDGVPLSLPTEMAFDGAGNLYVLGGELCVGCSSVLPSIVSKYDSHGNLVNSVYLSGGFLDTIVLLRVDKAGDLFLVNNSDLFGFNIVEYDPSSNLVD